MEHTRKCPICGNRHHKLLFKIKLANFDQYSCFNNFRIAYCTKCGFLLNDIYYTPEEINKFYVEESPYLTVSSHGAGGNSNADVERYEKYLSIIKPYINKKSRICDVGCAKGGLLEFLVANGYKNVYGVEMSPKLVEISKAAGLNIQLGNAAHIPLPIDRKKYDCLFFTNVFEHLFDLSEVLLSINNSLTENGHIFIEVPDYENYSNIDFYPYYHLLNPREHINHFSAYHLSLIMKQFGFDCVYTGHDILKLNNSRYGCNPSLIMVFTPPPHLTALLSDKIYMTIHRLNHTRCA
jgi:2-polyprenyl-3-methyl-5-hydroxy-6-metoxy-1,4-benzoquinol methylase